MGFTEMLGLEEPARLKVRRYNSRAALDALLRDFLGNAGPAAAAPILADAVGALVVSGKWSEADARTVLYTADRRIDRVSL
ncbi:MAG: hypothetical protein Q8K33_01700 [Cypionkella sp.]|uniref:hypothetical protein n=1 Tax=Cypionkella sp. TaxID=2811411 RepID=UPI0027318C35|nr:hypothetical protein [Cypionkella sp.]MDP2047596.1 hypothetical protein [Cypionkella sp.]